MIPILALMWWFLCTGAGGQMIGAAMANFDSNGNVTAATREFAQMLGYSLEVSNPTHHTHLTRVKGGPHFFVASLKIVHETPNIPTRKWSKGG